MRPLSRPVYTGEQYTDYKSYLKPLIKTFGQYCSYCERRDKLDVDHVAPKSKNRHLTLSWDNLLPACPRCNRDFKRSKNDNRSDYVWPDRDNTFELLHYYEDGRVKPVSGLTEPRKNEVENTIELVQLDDSEQSQIVLNLVRRDKFLIANKYKALYQQELINLDDILLLAFDGLWSVWLTVFNDIEEVKSALLRCEAYPNTYQW